MSKWKERAKGAAFVAALGLAGGPGVNLIAAPDKPYKDYKQKGMSCVEAAPFFAAGADYFGWKVEIEDVDRICVKREEDRCSANIRGRRWAPEEEVPEGKKPYPR